MCYGSVFIVCYMGGLIDIVFFYDFMNNKGIGYFFNCYELLDLFIVMV